MKSFIFQNFSAAKANPLYNYGSVDVELRAKQESNVCPCKKAQQIGLPNEAFFQYLVNKKAVKDFKESENDEFADGDKLWNLIKFIF